MRIRQGGTKNQHTVRYALDGAAQSLAVTSYTYEALPEAKQLALWLSRAAAQDFFRVKVGETGESGEIAPAYHRVIPGPASS